MNQNTEQDRTSKNFSETHSITNKKQKRSSMNPTIMYKSGIGASEPTGGHSRGESSSTHSDMQNRLKFGQNPISIGYSKSKVPPSTIDGSRKRYFSIFDSIQQIGNDGILMATIEQQRDEEHSKDGISKDERQILVKTMTFEGDQKRHSKQSPMRAPLIKLKQDSIPVEDSEMESQIDEIGEDSESGSRILDHFERDGGQRATPNRPVYHDTVESIVEKYKTPGLIRLNPRSELRNMINKVNRKIVVRSISNHSKASEAVRSVEHQSKEVNRTSIRVVKPPSLKLKQDYSLDQKSNQELDWEEEELAEKRNSTRQFQGHQSPIKKSIILKQIEQVNKLSDPSGDLLLESPFHTTPKYKIHSKQSVVTPIKSRISQNRLEDIQDYTPVNSSRLSISRGKGLGPGRDKPPKSPTTLVKKKVPNHPASMISIEAEMVGNGSPFIEENVREPHKKENISSIVELQDHIHSKKDQPLELRDSLNFSVSNNHTSRETSSEKAAIKPKLEPRKSHFSNGDNQTGRLGLLAERGLALNSISRKREPEKEDSRRMIKVVATPIKKPTSIQTSTINDDVFTQSFPLEKFKFLIFSNKIIDQKGLKTFIKEIKSDVDLVKQIQCKEQVPCKVALTNVDRSKNP